MATLESLHELLRTAARTLDEAARQIRDVPLEPRHENIVRIGKLLEGIDEIENQIYRLNPELIPEQLWEVSKGDWPKMIVEGAFRRAAKLEQAGNAQGAVQILEFLVQCQPAGSHVGNAKAEIARLSGNDG